MRDPVLHTLNMKRAFQAPINRVYQAFVDPKAINAWWAPEGWETPEVEMDPVVGGRYRFGMREIAGDGSMMYVIGEYIKVEENQLLEFSYIWEPGGEGERWRPFGLIDHRTVVRIEFHEIESHTEVNLTHSGFPESTGRDAHYGGWSSNLDELDRFFDVRTNDSNQSQN